VKATAAPGIFLATKEEVNQTFFRIGHLSGLLKDKDYPALEVMADILGGGFSSRLFRKVRTELGYAYSVGANWGANYNHPGIFSVSGSTKSESTTATIETILKEIDRIRTEEVTDQELKTAKETVLNSFVFNFDQPGKTLNHFGQRNGRNTSHETTDSQCSCSRSRIRGMVRNRFSPPVQGCNDQGG
jgi:zinc protease